MFYLENKFSSACDYRAVDIYNPGAMQTMRKNSQSEIYRRGNGVDHWNSSVARRSPLKDILGFLFISNHFQYRKCLFRDIGFLLDMPMISGTESLEFPVQIIDFLL